MSTNTETRDQDYPQTMHLGPNSGARVAPSYKTLRDEFAMGALTGLIAADRDRNVGPLAKCAYTIADAMMKARDQK